MKLRIGTLALGTVLLLSGCGTPAWMTQTPNQLAQATGIDPNDVELTEYCSFGIIDPENATLEHSVVTGAFIMTKSQIYLLNGKPSEPTMTLFRTIPVKSIRGVGTRSFGRAVQLQLIHDGRIIFMNFQKDAAWQDKEAPSSIHQKLTGEGVPQWTPVATYFQLSAKEAKSLTGELTKINPVKIP